MSTEDSKPRIRFGLIGFGQHAQRVFLPAISSSEKASLVAIASSNKDKQKNIEINHNEIELLASYEQLLTRKDIDAIYIALPNHLHCSWTIRCLEAGFHVLCEKPLALTVSEEEQIKDAANKAQRCVMEAFAYRHHPQHQLVLELLNSGTIGQLLSINAAYSYNLDDLNNIRLKKECGGGALNDVGCYLLDLCRQFTSTGLFSINRAFSTSYNEVDASTTIELKFGGDITASLYCSCRDERKNFYEVSGTNGTIRVCDAFHVPRNKSPKIEIFETGKPTKIVNVLKHNQFLTMIDCFCDRINDSIPGEFCITGNANLLEGVRIFSQQSS